MTVYTINLVWKRDGEDIELGACYQTTRPVVGELINYVSDRSPGHAGPWRVVLVYHQPFLRDSHTWRAWRECKCAVQPRDDLAYYWVEPAEGPWEG
jgi:hypothetical protein